MSKTPRRRRALAHAGGTILTAGDADAAARLAHALDVPPSTEDEGDISRAHVHGFHSYPARMHPVTAARLVSEFVPEGGLVLDPFCGSGTVLVESLIGGCTTYGVDLNPLAVRLTRCKTRPRQRAELERLVERARACAMGADERRRERAGATRRLDPNDTRLFEPHVALELDSLRSMVEMTLDESVRLDLSLVLSALLVKLSRKRGDTSSRIGVRRTAPGQPSRLFVQKTEDLARRLTALGRLLPARQIPRAFVEQDDAGKLRTLPSTPVDAIITSPPYAATYDYVEHHELRLRWLGLDASALARGEIGARTAYRNLSPRQASDKWAQELSRFFQAAARVLARGAPLALVMADSAVGGTALRADEIVAHRARECGFTFVARASQSRPHFHGPTKSAFRTGPRKEHAMLLCRD